jgi:hypothetical protein
VQCSSKVSACRRELNSHNAAKPQEWAALCVVGNRIQTTNRRVTIYLAMPECLFRHRLRPAKLHLAALRGNQWRAHNRPCESVCWPAAAGAAVLPFTVAGGGRNSSACAACSVSLLRYRKAWHPSDLNRLLSFAQCCLTPRSSRPATAGSVRLGRGPGGIFAAQPYAACLRGRLSSNVRQHKRGRAVLQQSQRLSA